MLVDGASVSLQLKSKSLKRMLLARRTERISRHFSSSSRAFLMDDALDDFMMTLITWPRFSWETTAFDIRSRELIGSVVMIYDMEDEDCDSLKQLFDVEY